MPTDCTSFNRGAQPPAGVTIDGRSLLPIGRDSSSGGYFRQPFLGAEREATAWFAAQCRARRLDLEADSFGNLIGWWRGEESPSERGVLTGSHLDSVLDGGAFDGPLGVVSALAAIDILRERGFRPGKPIGVAVFVVFFVARLAVDFFAARFLVAFFAGTDRLRIGGKRTAGPAGYYVRPF